MIELYICSTFGIQLRMNFIQLRVILQDLFLILPRFWLHWIFFEAPSNFYRH